MITEFGSARCRCADRRFNVLHRLVDATVVYSYAGEQQVARIRDVKTPQATDRNSARVSHVRRNGQGVGLRRAIDV